MPAALYAISFKKTGNLLAICSFEKQSPADDAAWDQLLATLIGDKLTMAIGPAGPQITLAPQYLAVDAISGSAQPENVITSLYSYRLDLPAAGTPADHKDKALVAVNTKQVTSMKIKALARQVVVTLDTLEGNAVNPVYLLFEGCDPVAHTTTALSPDVTIPIDPAFGPLAAGTRYRFVFVKADVAVTPGYLAAL